MVGTICPIVDGSHSKIMIQRRSLSLLAYVAGGLFGGAIFGFGISMMATWLPLNKENTNIFLGLGCASIFFSLMDLEFIPIRYKYFDHQVPARWRNIFPLPITSFLYGFELGTGITTLINNSMIYVVAISLIVLSPIQSMCLMLLYSLTRVTMIFFVGKSIYTNTQYIEKITSISPFSIYIRIISGICMAWTGSYLLVWYLLS